jgi:inorganic pyrophosphatase
VNGHGSCDHSEREVFVRILSVVGVVALPCLVAAQGARPSLDVLPAQAASQLARSLESAARHGQSVWRDTRPLNDDGTVNAYVEISRGDRRKWEFDIAGNARAIDRVLPADVGGYPVNYGFVPQTISYDGDPFDALVLGPPLPGGQVVRGVVVGLMFMEDEKGLDSKVVLSVPDGEGRPIHQLTPDEQRRIGDYFRRYKQHETGKFSKVPGWGSIADGRSHVVTAHAFFNECRRPLDYPCRVGR